VKTVMHQVRKDVRRHAPWLLAWAAVCILPLVALGIPADSISSRLAVNTIAPAVRVLLFAVLVALVVHEDPVVGSTAFWMTRPISGRALLAGKLVFVAMLLVLPAVSVDVAQVTSAGIGSRYVALAIPEITLNWVVYGACVLALASLTSTLSGMIGVALTVVVLASFLWWLPSLMARGPFLTLLKAFGSQDDSLSAISSLIATRTLVAFMVLSGAALCVASVQYHRRQLQLSWAILVAGLIGVLGLRSEWQWDLLAPPPSEVETAGLGARASVSIDSNGHFESQTIEQAGKAVEEKIVHCRVVVSGVELPLAGEVDAIDGSLRFDDGSRLAINGAERGNEFRSRWNPVALEALLGGVHFVNLASEGALTTAVLRLPAADCNRHADAPGHLTGTASLKLRSYRVAAELPLRPNAVYDRGLEHAAILAVMSNGGDFTVTIRERQLSLLLVPNPMLNRRWLFTRFNPNVLYVLRNKERREAFWPMQGMLFGVGWTFGAGMDESMMMQQYRSNIVSEPPLPHIDDAWTAGADLVRIEAETVGSVTKPVEVERFVITRDSARH